MGIKYIKCYITKYILKYYSSCDELQHCRTEMTHVLTEFHTSEFFFKLKQIIYLLWICGFIRT